MADIDLDAVVLGGRQRADLLHEAERRLATGDPLGAERLLAGLWADTTHAPAPVLHLLGRIRWAQRRPPDAERYFRRAIEAEPEAPLYRAALGDVLAWAGAHAEAIGVYDAALARDPDNAPIAVSLARSALAAARPADAERAARRAIATAPSAEAWELLAHALGLRDLLDEALSAVGEALALEPDRETAQYLRIDLLARIGRNEAALAALDEMAVLHGASAKIAFRRGAVLSNLTRLAEAEAEFAEGVARWPRNVAMQNALANARWMRGEGAQFARDFEAAVAANPDDTLLRLHCADLLRHADFRDRAEGMLCEGLSRAPDDPALLQSLGVVFDELDRTAEALKLLERAMTLRPHVQTRINLVCALLRLGRGDEALRALEPALRDDPLNQGWIGYQTLALRQIGDPRYRELCDYDTMVRPYFLSPPPGFSTIEAFNEALAVSLKRLHVLETHPLDQSVRGGSQTSRSLMHVDDPIIQTFIKMRDEPIRDYMAAMSKADPNHPWSGRNTGKYRITGAWSVKLKPGGYHINHVHPAGWISGPYYVHVPKVVSEGEGQQGWVTFGEPRWPTPGCPVEKIVQPQAGLQVLFPSYMWHGTIPFSEGERMTAPLDAAPA
ncbi:MAG: 2OG-Fe(II) oxygenase family protein [Hyphomonadaceae bacterium]